MTLTSTGVDISHQWFVSTNTSIRGMPVGLEVRNDQQHANADSNFRETNTVFGVRGNRIGHIAREVNICLLLSSMPCLWRWFNRNRSRKIFADLNALGPCVIKLCVTVISAVLEPSTAASTTAAFAGFLASAALGTAVGACYRELPRHRRCFCGEVQAFKLYKRYWYRCFTKPSLQIDVQNDMHGS